MAKKIVCAIMLTVLALGLSVLVYKIPKAEANGLKYDLNGDGKVDINDVAIAARAFGATAGHPRWDSKADVDGDSKITLMDIYTISRHFGETIS